MQAHSDPIGTRKRLLAEQTGIGARTSVTVRQVSG